MAKRTPRAQLDTQEVRQVQLVPAEFIDCRTFGHAWKAIPLSQTEWRPVFGIGLALRCRDCGMERHDTVNSFRDGAVGARSYKQPEGYSMEKEYTPDRNTIRLQWMKVHQDEMLGRSTNVVETVAAPVERKKPALASVGEGS